MKLLTYTDENQQISSGLAVSKFHSVYRQNAHTYTSISTDDDDYFVRIGDGNISTGRVLLNRENPPSIEKQKIYTADLWIPLSHQIEDIYLTKESDPLNNKLYIKLVGVENLVLLENTRSIDFPIGTFHSQDEYLIKVHPEQSLRFDSIYTGESLTIRHTCQRITDSIKIILTEDSFIIS